ncbi:chalcone isomerase family protein [Methylobacillus sp. Pita2]|jgi:hypothetical protein|uniref:chalcone isomerase family protein n=1 Tax=Methylobacillus sp. Pita2 TaxID=3383245 RepID=UPI0038B62367
MQAIQDFFSSQNSDNSLEWHMQGSGVLTWSVFSIYRATLWTAGPLKLHNNQPANSAFALQFEYLRNVSADYIAEASQRELLRLAEHPEQLVQSWMQGLREILPDAGRGDLLWILFRPALDVGFYKDGHRLGEIVDPAFCQAFSGIWFHENCHNPRLRKQLLKEA